MVAVNISAVVHLTHLFCRPWSNGAPGYIMIVASTAAFQPVPYISTYAATKGFDLLLAEGLAEEMRSYGVRVRGLCPGSTVSEFHDAAGQPRVQGGKRQATDEVARAGLEGWRRENRELLPEQETGLAWERNDWSRGAGDTGGCIDVPTRTRDRNATTHKTNAASHAMNIDQLTGQLREEGFGHAYVWQDGPHASYRTMLMTRKQPTLSWKAR